MMALINDILDISAIEAGKRSFEKAPVDLEKIMESAVRNFEPAATEKQIEISLHLPEQVPKLVADNRSVIQILQNLLSNAIKYTEPNGEVSLSVDSNGKSVDLQINDTGVGIREQDLSRITEPFSRPHSNPHLAQEGTGLGLSIVKSLVEAHDGQLSITSSPGKGTKVCVTLPMPTPNS